LEVIVARITARDLAVGNADESHRHVSRVTEIAGII
jgi:hypothetical protein